MQLSRIYPTPLIIIKALIPKRYPILRLQFKTPFLSRAYINQDRTISFLLELQWIIVVQQQYLMAAVIAQGMCCCFMCCCKDISDAFKRFLGPQRVTKVFYLFLVVAFTVPAIVVFFYINKWQSIINYFSWMRCPQSSGGGLQCIGPSAIYRMSLSFLVLFVLMMVIMACRNRLAMVINEGLFCVKYLLVLGVFVAFLFVRNEVFVEYSSWSKYISIAFMIIQSIILIDLFYLAGIKLVKRYDQGQTSCGAVLVLLSLIFFAAGIMLNVLGYVYFGKEDSCGDSLWINILNSILLVILPAIQSLNFNKQNSLLTTAMVCTYVSYLSFICQFSYGGGACVGRMTDASLAADIIVSTLFFVLAMYGSIMGGSGQVKIANIDLNQAVGGPASKKGDPYAPNAAVPLKNQLLEGDEVNLQFYRDWSWPHWHFYMCLASLYVGMLITNWTSASITTNTLISNDFGFWVRATISWITAILYIWTLVAPRVCLQRDFTVV